MYLEDVQKFRGDSNRIQYRGFLPAMSYAKQTMDAPHQVNDASRGSQSHMMYCITAAYGQLGGGVVVIPDRNGATTS